jgi:hypothetical protein
MAAQMSMAGRTCTRVSRQLVNRSLTPWNSMAKAPTARVSGASSRLRWLRASTVLSTMASSPVRMAPTMRSNRARTLARRVVAWVAVAPAPSTPVASACGVSRVMHPPHIGIDPITHR